ncbi:MAG: acetoin utilization protein AcuC [Planctomycetes bacterium]|nr:acetoin utilization protein AcuC [Planctomycetota bacterium]
MVAPPHPTDGANSRIGTGFCMIGGMGDSRIVDATALPVYDLGQDHPFARDRQRPLFDLLRRSGLLHAADVLPTVPATEAELATVHDPDYIAILQATSVPRPDPSLLRQAPLFGLGTADNPIARGQHTAAAAAVGATLTCVREVLAGRCRAAFNPAGGLHHAMPHGAAGFCLYNDLAVGIRHARGNGCERVLYVDFDVHQGDGVEFTFRSDPTVVTLSFHETPLVRFPFTGFVTDLGEGAGRGYALNVPLQPGTADDSWIECVDRVLEAAVTRFRPDLIVSQHGCDPHRSDPLATIECTTRSFLHAAQKTRELAAAVCDGRWVATGGGGYQPYSVIPRAWGMVWATMSGRAVPTGIDQGWLQTWQPIAGAPLPKTWLDEPQPAERHRDAAAVNRKTVAELFAAVPWLRG